MIGNLVVIRMSANGLAFEVWEDPTGYGYRRVRKFKHYDDALAFAEKEATENNLQLVDYASSYLKEVESGEGLTAEERLLRAIFGDKGD